MPRNDSPDAGEDDDVRLMQLVGAGNMAAFERLVERHQTLVSGTVARMIGDNSDVEDIAQQVFVRVWKSARRYVPQAKFTTWLLKITRNLVFNELRRRKRHAAIPFETADGKEELQVEDKAAESPDAVMLERELQEAIDSAIAELPEVQRMALILRRYKDLPYEEIGEVLDLSVSAVKSVLFRARTELRQRLAAYLGPP